MPYWNESNQPEPNHATPSSGANANQALNQTAESQADDLGLEKGPEITDRPKEAYRLVLPDVWRKSIAQSDEIVAAWLNGKKQTYRELSDALTEAWEPSHGTRLAEQDATDSETRQWVENLEHDFERASKLQAKASGVAHILELGWKTPIRADDEATVRKAALTSWMNGLHPDRWGSPEA